MNRRWALVAAATLMAAVLASVDVRQVAKDALNALVGVFLQEQVVAEPAGLYNTDAMSRR